MRFCIPGMRPRSAAAAAAACLLLALFACAGNESAMPADKAFALSASALSASDRYGFDGVVSIFDPNGRMAGKSKFRGEVTGHGNLNLKWSGEPQLRTRSAKGPAAFHPLKLLDAIQNRTANVSYTKPPYPEGAVQLRILLSEETASARIAEGLRAEMNQLKNGMKNRKMDAHQRMEADRLLEDAQSHLETVLSTLKVNTRCLWTADRRNWFPRQMTEETVLDYIWQGKPYREKRVSVTNFLPGGRSGTMLADS